MRSYPTLGGTEGGPKRSAQFLFILFLLVLLDSKRAAGLFPGAWFIILKTNNFKLQTLLSSQKYIHILKYNLKMEHLTSAYWLQQYLSNSCTLTSVPSSLIWASLGLILLLYWDQRAVWVGVHIQTLHRWNYVAGSLLGRKIL